ncbi:MAG: ATP-binding cassette domain-containing protein, partial [Anaerolineae bacterium]|nr:ATP-binding cassette domain-containing protein [Anaerolineae bacterium]
ILGFAGLVGAGRTETVRLIFGADPKDSGEILIEGKPVTITSPRDALAAGIGLVPEDRGNHGLVLTLSVLENIVLPSLDRHTRLRVWLDRLGLLKTAQEFVNKLNIRIAQLQQKAMFLSGGNQQKTVVAKWLALRPRILIMDEPTRGIDVGAKAEIHALMSQLAQEGIGIIMVSSELPEILGMSDRILV